MKQFSEEEKKLIAQKEGFCANEEQLALWDMIKGDFYKIDEPVTRGAVKDAGTIFANLLYSSQYDPLYEDNLKALNEICCACFDQDLFYDVVWPDELNDVHNAFATLDGAKRFILERRISNAKNRKTDAKSLFALYASGNLSIEDKDCKEKFGDLLKRYETSNNAEIKQLAADAKDRYESEQKVVVPSVSDFGQDGKSKEESEQKIIIPDSSDAGQDSRSISDITKEFDTESVEPLFKDEIFDDKTDVDTPKEENSEEKPVDNTDSISEIVEKAPIRDKFVAVPKFSNLDIGAIKDVIGDKFDDIKAFVKDTYNKYKPSKDTNDATVQINLIKNSSLEKDLTEVTKRKIEDAKTEFVDEDGSFGALTEKLDDIMKKVNETDSLYEADKFKNLCEQGLAICEEGIKARKQASKDTEESIFAINIENDPSIALINGYKDAFQYKMGMLDNAKIADTSSVKDFIKDKIDDIKTFAKDAYNKYKPSKDTNNATQEKIENSEEKPVESVETESEPKVEPVKTESEPKVESIETEEKSADAVIRDDADDLNNLEDVLKVTEEDSLFKEDLYTDTPLVNEEKTESVADKQESKSDEQSVNYTEDKPIEVEVEPIESVIESGEAVDESVKAKTGVVDTIKSLFANNPEKAKIKAKEKEEIAKIKQKLVNAKAEKAELEAELANVEKELAEAKEVFAKSNGERTGSAESVKSKVEPVKTDSEPKVESIETDDKSAEAGVFEKLTGAIKTGFNKATSTGAAAWNKLSGLLSKEAADYVEDVLKTCGLENVTPFSGDKTMEAFIKAAQQLDDEKKADELAALLCKKSINQPGMVLAKAYDYFKANNQEQDCERVASEIFNRISLGNTLNSFNKYSIGRLYQETDAMLKVIEDCGTKYGSRWPNIASAVRTTVDGLIAAHDAQYYAFNNNVKDVKDVVKVYTDRYNALKDAKLGIQTEELLKTVIANDAVREAFIDVAKRTNALRIDDKMPLDADVMDALYRCYLADKYKSGIQPGDYAGYSERGFGLFCTTPKALDLDAIQKGLDLIVADNDAFIMRLKTKFAKASEAQFKKLETLYSPFIACQNILKIEQAGDNRNLVFEEYSETHKKNFEQAVNDPKFNNDKEAAKKDEDVVKHATQSLEDLAKMENDTDTIIEICNEAKQQACMKKYKGYIDSCLDTENENKKWYEEEAKQFEQYVEEKPTNTRGKSHSQPGSKFAAMKAKFQAAKAKLAGIDYAKRKDILFNLLKTTVGAFVASAAVSAMATAGTALTGGIGGLTIAVSAIGAIVSAFVKYKMWQRQQKAQNLPFDFKTAMHDKRLLLSMGRSALAMIGMLCGYLTYAEVAKLLGIAAVAVGGLGNVKETFESCKKQGLGKIESWIWAVLTAGAAIGGYFGGRAFGEFVGDKIVGPKTSGANMTTESTSEQKAEPKTTEDTEKQGFFDRIKSKLSGLFDKDVDTVDSKPKAETVKVETKPEISEPKTEPVKVEPKSTETVPANISEAVDADEDDVFDISKVKITKADFVDDGVCVPVDEEVEYTPFAKQNAQAITSKWYAGNKQELVDRVELIKNASAKHGIHIDPHRAIMLHADAGGKTFDNTLLENGQYTHGNHKIFGSAWAKSKGISQDEIDAVKNMFQGKEISKEAMEAAAKLDQLVSDKNQIGFVNKHFINAKSKYNTYVDGVRAFLQNGR